jgi:hypothetical protein
MSCAWAIPSVDETVVHPARTLCGAVAGLDESGHRLRDLLRRVAGDRNRL